MLTQSRLIDEDVFTEVIGQDPEHLDTIIILFEEQAAENISALEQSLKRNDSLAFKHAAHSLKNLGRNLAVNSLVQQSEELENLGSANALRIAAAKISQAVNLIDGIREELKTLRKKLS